MNDRTERDMEIELQLAPPEEKPARSPGVELTAKDDVDSAGFADDSPAMPRPQFTLRELMQVVFFAAVGFAVLRVAPPDLFAGAMGALAIVGLAVLTWVKPEKTIYYLAWWTLLGVYVIASVVAVVSKKA